MGIFEDVGFKGRIRFHGQFREDMHVPGSRAQFPIAGDVQRAVGAAGSCWEESASALVGAPWKSS